MSQTEALGVADVSRWVGVAASMVDYLDCWLANEQAPPPVPRGIFAGARRFLTQVQEGIALDRRERVQTKIPIMAGISNLTIALGVLHRLAPPQDPGAVEAKVRAYLSCLQAIEQGEVRSDSLVEQVQALKAFFHELQGQGNRARHATFAQEEAPQA